MRLTFAALAVVAAQAVTLDHEFAGFGRGAPMVRGPRPAPQPAMRPAPEPVMRQAPEPVMRPAPEPVMMKPTPPTTPPPMTKPAPEMARPVMTKPAPQMARPVMAMPEPEMEEEHHHQPVMHHQPSMEQVMALQEMMRSGQMAMAARPDHHVEKTHDDHHAEMEIPEVVMADLGDAHVAVDMREAARRFSGPRNYWAGRRYIPRFKGPIAGVFEDDVPQYANVEADRHSDPIRGPDGYGIFRPDLDNVEPTMKYGHPVKDVKFAGNYDHRRPYGQAHAYAPIPRRLAEKEQNLEKWGLSAGPLAAKITPTSTAQHHWSPYGPQVTPVAMAPVRFDKDGEKAMPALRYGEPDTEAKPFSAPYMPSFSKSVTPKHTKVYRRRAYY